MTEIEWLAIRNANIAPCLKPVRCSLNDKQWKVFQNPSIYDNKSYIRQIRKLYEQTYKQKESSMNYWVKLRSNYVFDPKQLLSLHLHPFKPRIKLIFRNGKDKLKFKKYEFAEAFFNEITELLMKLKPELEIHQSEMKPDGR